jgi:ribosomal protein L23
MMKRATKKTVTTEVTTYYEITADDIRTAFCLPASARITFRVPSGGDWSGDVIEISKDDPIHVVSKNETVSEMTP